MAKQNQEPTILERQGMGNVPLPDSFDRGTNLLLPPRRVAEQLKNFSEEIYDLRAESHLTRLLKVVLGDAGAGQVRKRYLLQRLQGSCSGSAWLDLDNFYGAIFKISRNPEETLSLNPYIDLGTSHEWRDEIAKDASFKSRVSQLARAISWGTSAIGMELASEAVLGADVDIFESWQEADLGSQTYGDIEADIGTYAGMELFTYGELSGVGNLTLGSKNRFSFLVQPKRAITEFERYNLIRVLNKIKPINALMQINAEGVPVHVPVNPIAIYADSTRWEIVTQVNTQAYGLQVPYQRVDPLIPSEQPRPVWTGYQGEAWTYNFDVNSVISYWMNPFDFVTHTSVDETVRFLDGTKQTYSASRALTPWQALLAGRISSDGILTSGFYNTTRSSKSGLATAPLYADRIPIADLIAAIEGKNNIKPFNSDSYFWSTMPRLATNGNQEVLEMTLNDNRLINYFSVEVPNFPHKMTVEYSNLGVWTTLFTNTVNTSLPRIISGLTEPVHLHPQHSTSGHWRRVGGKIGEFKTNKFRIRMVRISNANDPVNHAKQSIPYSLGLRNLEIGFRINSLEDAPRVDGEFAVSTDILGSSISYSVREERASGLLGSPTVPWRCDPQPVSNSVVNLYLDMRDPEGNPQVIDRMYLDPTYIGPTMHLYWSNGEASGDFKSSDDRIPPSVATQVGSVVYTPNGVSLSNTNPSGFRIDNGSIQLNKVSPWWIGMEIVPDVPSSAMTSNTILNLPTTRDGAIHNVSDNLLLFSSNSLIWMNYSNSLDFPVFFQAGSVIRLILAWIPEATLELSAGIHVWVQINGETFDHQTFNFDSFPDGRLSLIDIGSDLTGGVAPFDLTSFCVKQEIITENVAETFLLNPNQYVLKPADRNATDLTRNALVRFDIQFYHSNNSLSTGFVGGNATDIYENLEWTPIERDYVLQKGFYHFNPTSAKFWNLEFTNLAPQPHEVMTSIKKTVKLHPTVSILDFQRSLASGVVNVPPGFDTNQNLSRTSQFRDAWPAINKSNFSTDTTQNLDTHIVYAKDPTKASELRDQSSLLGFKQWQPNTVAPVFAAKSVHDYTEVEIDQTEKVSFMVGLQKIQPYRVDYTAFDNTLAYIEHFFDQVNIESGVV